MDLETIWYECSPYLYAIAAAISIFHIGSMPGVVIGLLLAINSGLIFKMRWNYRKTRFSKKMK